MTCNPYITQEYNLQQCMPSIHLRNQTAKNKIRHRHFQPTNKVTVDQLWHSQYIRLNIERMKTQWSHSSPIESLYKQLKEGKYFAQQDNETSES